MSFLTLGGRPSTCSLPPRVSVGIERDGSRGSGHHRLGIQLNAAVLREWGVEYGARIGVELGTLADAGLLILDAEPSGATVKLSKCSHATSVKTSVSLRQLGAKVPLTPMTRCPDWRVGGSRLVIVLPGEIVRALGPALRGERAA